MEEQAEARKTFNESLCRVRACLSPCRDVGEDREDADRKPISTQGSGRWKPPVLWFLAFLIPAYPRHLYTGTCEWTSDPVLWSDR